MFVGMTLVSLIGMGSCMFGLTTADKFHRSSLLCERRVIDQRADSSVGGVPVGSCLEDIHMEEKGVKVQVQAEEEEEGETHGRQHGEDEGEAHDTWITVRMRRSVHPMWYHTSFSTRIV